MEMMNGSKYRVYTNIKLTFCDDLRMSAILCRTGLSPKSLLDRGDESRPALDRGSGSVRLFVALFEPDNYNFNEFSYTQLLARKVSDIETDDGTCTDKRTPETSKSNRKDDQTRSTFEVEEQREKERMTELVRKMEKKYSVKKKRDRVQDLIDIGYGYDDEDSFIDNSEAYDEFVPSSITTKHGGFYINSGVLHFRQVSDTETDDGATEERTSETSKKHKLKDGQEMPKKKRRRKVLQHKNDEDANSSMTSELGAGVKLMKKKKKKVVGTLSVTSMLKKFRREKELERKKMETAYQQMAAIPLTPVPADAGGGGGGGLGLADPLISLIGSTDEQALLQAASTVEFDIDLDCLLAVADEISTPPPLMEAPPLNHPRADHHLPETSCDAVRPPSRKTTPPQKPHSELVSSVQCATLPDGLPPSLEDSIKKLMLAAKTSEGESKLKFFTPEINSVLLDIECQCREHGGPLRSRVYAHLSSFLPCSKETLLKRVKKLKLAAGLSNVEDPMQKLKEAIGRAMPEQITCFNQHCQEYEQVKTLRAMEEDGSDVRQGGQGNNVEEKGAKRGGAPKKLFKWNDEIREVLRHVLRGKLSVFESTSEETQQLEEHLKAVLVNDIKPLWPKGWMQSRVLLRESRTILGLQLTFPTKRSKSGKQLSIIAPSTSDQNTGPLSQVELPREANTVIENSRTSNVTAAAAEMPAHEVFAAAINKYKSSLQHWSAGVADVSPLHPPPPPQCSPVNFPEVVLYRHAVPPKLMQDFMCAPADSGPHL
ncbi:ubinuclein-1 isoform X2 [Festucalex cinctus]